MNLEQAIEDELVKWCRTYGWDKYSETAIDLSASLHSIALATADALKVETVSLHDEYNEEESKLMVKIFGSTTTSKYIKERRKGYNSSISDSQQREQEWFGIKAETPLVDNKEV